MYSNNTKFKHSKNTNHNNTKSKHSKNTNHNNTKSKHSKNTNHNNTKSKFNHINKPYGKYIKEFNTALNRDIYYIPNQHIMSAKTRPKTLNYILNYDPSDNLLRFVLKMVDRRLYQYTDAKKKFKEYLGVVDRSGDKFELYARLNKYYLQLHNEYKIQNQLNETRGQTRAKSINKYITQIANSDSNIAKMPLINKYLDIGCFDGHISKAIGESFELTKSQTYGVDIKSYNTYDDITFMLYDGKKLPFDDESFELITCLMTLHHINPLHLNSIIDEIARVLKPGGVVILREHDVELDQQPNESICLDIMHDFYDYVWNINNDQNWNTTDNHSINNYKNNSSWTQLFHARGLSTHIQADILCDFQRNLFMSYVCSYMKI